MTHICPWHKIVEQIQITKLTVSQGSCDTNFSQGPLSPPAVCEGLHKEHGVSISEKLHISYSILKDLTIYEQCIYLYWKGLFGHYGWFTGDVPRTHGLIVKYKFKILICSDSPYPLDWDGFMKVNFFFLKANLENNIWCWVQKLEPDMLPYPYFGSHE